MDKIGRFDILSEIAHSPLARVYKASDPENGQTVALKAVSLKALGDQASSWVQQVLEEADTTKNLSSHNIAMIYGAGDIDDQFCAAMEYIQGSSVADNLARQEGFSLWDLQDIARQVCQGLDHAHSQNVFHYSLEPAKIMVAWDGTVKILGFGISSMGIVATQGGGPPAPILHYMSPEQLRGEALDARSNIFSLGAILYEMMTERKAFPGEESEQVRERILNSMPVPPHMVNSKVPPGLSDVLMKALSKLPEQRFLSGQELVNALEQCKQETPKAGPRKAPQAVHGLNIPRGASSGASPAVPEPSAQPEPAPTISAKAPRSAAVAAGAGPASAASAQASRTANLSAAWPTEAEVDAPAAAPPTTGASTGSIAAPAKSKPSFSDISELPPLKEVYTAPAPPPEPEPVQETPAAPAAPSATLYRGDVEPEKPKTPPKEIARKAVREIRNTPPKLYLYGIGAAAAVILLIIAAIAYHIHSENSVDEGSTTPPATSIAEPAGESQTTTPAPQAPPVTVRTVPEAAEKQPARSTMIAVPAKRGKRRAVKVARAPVIVPGQLSVNSTPAGAQVRIDGQEDPGWVTPANITGIEPGQHMVTIKKEGYVSETRSIEVGSGGKSFLVVQLASAGATAAISSVPSGAEVLVDGKDIGHATPVQITVQKPGVHSFVVRKSGYLDETTTASLQPGQTFQFAPVLRQLGHTEDIHYGGRFKKLFGGGDTAGMGSLKVSTDPKGAQIMVNHKMLDRASPAEFYLNPGVYVIDITLHGYKSVHRVMNIDKGGKFSIDETMEPQ